ncbi:L-rhamnose mutarotase [Cardiobacteriaceae bacterium TAE3-ERU3]|nr:L-rhamnose mutarotase [Cardiobacteriaceae bacterium TAE3-ERU3]
MQYILFLDLKDDPKLIEAYEAHHRNVWPEVIAHIRDCGIEEMKIYRRGNRLVMLMEVNDQFTFAAMDEKLAERPKIQEWEELMSTFQQPLPEALDGEKWLPAELIFDLADA